MFETKVQKVCSLTLYFIIPRTGSSTQSTENRTTFDLSFLISPDVSTNSIVKVFSIKNWKQHCTRNFTSQCKSIQRRLPISLKTFPANCSSHSWCPIAHINIELKFTSVRPDS